MSLLLLFRGPPVTYTATVSGGAVFSGASVLVRTTITLTSGGVVFSGAVTFIKDRFLTSAGGAVFSGIASLIRTRLQNPTGLVAFSGTAAMTFIPVVLTPSIPQRTVVGVGI